MPKVVITHNVTDVDTWLGFKAERAGAIESLGGSNVVDQVALDGSNRVVVSLDVDDVDALVATLASPPPEMGEIMGRHGVVPPLTVYVEK